MCAPRQVVAFLLLGRLDDLLTDEVCWILHGNPRLDFLHELLEQIQLLRIQ